MPFSLAETNTIHLSFIGYRLSKILIISQQSLHLNHLSICQDWFVSLTEGCDTVLVRHHEHADQQIAALGIDLPREATEQHSPQSQASVYTWVADTTTHFNI